MKFVLVYAGGQVVTFEMDDYDSFRETFAEDSDLIRMVEDSKSDWFSVEGRIFTSKGLRGFWIE